MQNFENQTILLLSANSQVLRGGNNIEVPIADYLLLIGGNLATVTKAEPVN